MFVIKQAGESREFDNLFDPVLTLQLPPTSPPFRSSPSATTAAILKSSSSNPLIKASGLFGSLPRELLVLLVLLVLRRELKLRREQTDFESIVRFHSIVQFFIGWLSLF
jgi:hypothetical protein